MNGKSENRDPDPARAGALFVLVFLSGVAALIYQVLWLKELGLLFGVTAYAAATTLAVFFIGLSAGSFVWGRRSARASNPLRLYAGLELGIAVSALLFFFILDVYVWISAPVFSAIGYRPGAMLAVKFLLAVGILFLPAFFMGGTVPVMAQFLIRRASDLGKRASLLYSLNTVGAALGALLAGFFLPRYLGFQNSYLVAISLNLIIAAAAFQWSRRSFIAAPAPLHVTPVSPDETRVGHADGHTPTPGAAADLPPALIWTTAFVSGLVTLALEVLWTRMFAQVLQNSVYTFSVILTVFLVALGLGSAVASAICRRPWSARVVLFVLLTASGCLVGITPVLFYRASAGLEFLGSSLGWSEYIVAVFGQVGLILLLPTVVMGTVFPYLLKLSERHMTSAGRTVGQLAAVNTIAAILGSLLAGFLLLDWIGLWASIRLMAVVYLVVALLATPPHRRIRLALVPAAGIVLFGIFLTYSGFSNVRLDAEHDETLVEVLEGSQGTVAVTNRDSGLGIKVNNSYLLGTSGATINARLQSFVPLSLHASPRSVFYLGLGTGITASGALQTDTDRVVICELNRDVVRASRTHFQPYLNGLFEDERVRILVEDGRTFLAVSRESFDVIVADIFLTYKAGVGSLYTREHFEIARARLESHGLFVQWLPLFDLSWVEFGIVARTMLEVFPQVTLWRRGFSPSYPVFALIGQLEEAPLDGANLRRHLENLGEQGALPERVWMLEIPLAAYAGNITAARALFESYPISTDDRTPLEYLAPILERESRGAGRIDVLAWANLAALCDSLQRRVPPSHDPYLAEIDESEIAQVPAGLAFYRYETHRRLNQPTKAIAYLREYQRLLDTGTATASP